jgi:hypothetical protein
MNDRDSAHDDYFQRMANLTDHAGIDSEKSSRINESALDVLAQVIEKMKDTKIEASRKVVCPHCNQQSVVEFFDLEKFTKSAVQLGKMVDVNVRMTQFIQGKEDSRPGGSAKGNDWLQCLTPAQLAQVQGWILENQEVK